MNEIIEQMLDYLRGIWRHRWPALLCAWMIGVVGWTVVLLLPDQYQASARVFVDTQSILRPLLQGLTVEVNPDAQVGLVARTLLSRPNLEQIAHTTGLDAQVQDPAALDRLLNRLKERIDLVGAGRENLYTITFEDRDPQRAKQVVQTVVEVFAANLVGDTRQDSDAAQRFLEEQISEYEARLVEAENRLKDFKIKNVGRMPSEGQNYYARLQQVATELEATRLKLAQAESRRNALQQQLSGSARPPTDSEGEAVVLPVDARISSLEQKLDELLIQYTDRHPDVSILRQTVADLKRQREQELAQYAAGLAGKQADNGARRLNANPVYQQLKVALAREEANLASLRVQADEYERRRRELQNQVSTIPKIEAELVALNRDYEINRKKHDELVGRRESARLSPQAEQSKQDVRFKIVDPPRAPPKPTGPRRLLLLSLVLAVGLGAGVGLAFLWAQLWPTFDSRRALLRVTQMPVFGSVGLVRSPAAQRRERWQMGVYVALLGLLLLSYAGLVAVQMLRASSVALN